MTRLANIASDHISRPHGDRAPTSITATTDSRPGCQSTSLTKDTDVTVKVCKLWFHEPELSSQDISDLLEPEHPNINTRGITTIVRNAVEKDLVTARINYPSGKDTGGNTARKIEVCKLWFHYPHLSARDIADRYADLNGQNVAAIVRNALRDGLVSMQINYPRQLVDLLTLETDLLRTFPKLRVAKVTEASADVLAHLEEPERRRLRRDIILRLAPLAAGIVEQCLQQLARTRPDQRTIVGVGWGVTLYYLLRHLAASPRPRIGSGLEFVPIIGQTARPQELGLDAYNLATRLAELYGGSAWSLSAPALLKNALAWQAERFPSVARVLIMLERAHVVINSVAPIAHGGVGDVKLSNDPNVNEALLTSNGWQNACGRIGLSFFSDRGHEIPLTHHRAIGMRLAGLRAVALDPERIALTITAGSPAHVPALLGALRGNLISHLLVDECTARALVAAEQERFARKS